MIKTVKGDVTKASEDIILHQVNCQGKMASGVAKGIRKVFPKAYEEYMNLYNQQVENYGDASNLLGHAQVIQVGDSDFSSKYIVNLFGQEFYGYDGQRYTSYDALYEGFTYIAKHAKRANKSIAMPYMIGCVRGGASWNIVSHMIEQIFEGVEVTLYQYEEGK